MSNITAADDIGLDDAALGSLLERCWSNGVKEVSVITLDREEDSLSANPIVLRTNNVASEGA